MKAQRVVEVQFYYFFNLGARWEWVFATPQPLYPGKEIRYPLYRKMGGPWTNLDECGKFGPHR
jgi:hypothetical protein